LIRRNDNETIKTIRRLIQATLRERITSAPYKG